MTYDEETEIYLQCAERLRARGFHVLATIIEGIAEDSQWKAEEEEPDDWKEVEA